MRIAMVMVVMKIGMVILYDLMVMMMMMVIL